MASTASDLIKFEKMATGEKSGTWGTLANTAMSRIEESIAGMTTITLAGSNYTLDDTQYVEHTSTTAQSHLAIIKAIGTPGTSRTIVVPLRTKKYLIWNATTDGSALAVGGSSGATVTIANGNLAEVFCDGTNVEFCGPQITTAGVMVSATATTTGVVELATNAEAITGTDTARAITAANLLAANAIATKKGADIASGSPTVTTDGNYFDVTGTTTVAAWAVAADRHFYTQFDAILQLTHHTTNLDLPGLANITTAAGDVAEWQSTGSNTCQCVAYTKADGTAVAVAAVVGGGPSKGTAPSTFYRTNGKVQNENIVISNHSATFSAVHGAETASRGTDDGFADDMNVRLTGSDLPNGWVIDTDYFVRDVASATLKLALTIGGSAVAISDNGSGTNTIFEVINAGVIGPITIKSGNTLTIPSGSRVLIQ